jgi:hypothetical protein
MLIRLLGLGQFNQRVSDKKTFLLLQELANNGGPSRGCHGQGALSWNNNASYKSLRLLLSLYAPSLWLVMTTTNLSSLLLSHATCLLHPLFALAAMPMLLLHDFYLVPMCALTKTHHNYINHNPWDFCSWMLSLFSTSFQLGHNLKYHLTNSISMALTRKLLSPSHHYAS